MNRIISTTAIALTFILGQPVTGNAAEIKVWAARAIATVLAEIGPQFERTTGHKLKISSDLPTAFMRRANAGEHFDILISGSAPVDEWIKDGISVPLIDSLPHDAVVSRPLKRSVGLLSLAGQINYS